MIKVVLDTNVVVSALMSPDGNPAQILNMVFNGDIQVCHNEGMLVEYKDVLPRPSLKILPEKANRFLEILSEIGTSIEPIVSTVQLPHESDRAFYDTARECAAILITGNIKHYPTENFIMTPREFLDLADN
jgi:putative PIN family toxin of toxin-antitoxin system